MFAAAKLGAVVVNVNTQWTRRAARPTSPRTAAPGVLIVEPRAAAALAAAPLAGVGRARARDGRRADRDGFDDRDAHAPPSRPRRGAAARHRARGDHVHLGLDRPAQGRHAQPPQHPRRARARWRATSRLREDDRLLGVLPYSFDYGLNQLTTMMLTGGTVIHQPVAMAAEIVAAAVARTARPASPRCRRSGARSCACSTSARRRCRRCAGSPTRAARSRSTSSSACRRSSRASTSS